MFEEIGLEIDRAAANGQKVAMLHFQVLKNARQLATTDPTEFCRLVRVPQSYAIEFRKMLALARLLDEQGVRLA